MLHLCIFFCSGLHAVRYPGVGDRGGPERRPPSSHHAQALHRQWLRLYLQDPYGVSFSSRDQTYLWHPLSSQGRGKIERFNRRIKEKICLMVYCSPGEFKTPVDDAIAIYNRTAHESLSNVSANDVYAGRKEVILQKPGLAATPANHKNIDIQRGLWYSGFHP